MISGKTRRRGLSGQTLTLPSWIRKAAWEEARMDKVYRLAHNIFHGLLHTQQLDTTYHIHCSTIRRIHSGAKISHVSKVVVSPLLIWSHSQIGPLYVFPLFHLERLILVMSPHCDPQATKESAKGKTKQKGWRIGH
ncbi:hypothetical protein RJT34_26470 [Clitoria ternatea]|uniref:Uncharacterized protein n=1 Tax=Clitoria ternatea TaxID=43366 RepID=A0AAN9I961_CLITE